MSDLVRRLRQGERGAIARALSIAERRDDAGAALIDEIFASTGKALRIGITGAPGVGKSSLVDVLASRLRTRGRVGILAVDPSSAITQGAILGDRIRMTHVADKDDVFIRSLASRGHLGGLSAATADAADVLDAAGFTTVIIETVGVGQSEVEIADVVDVVVVVLAPGAGDGIQAIKAGLLEIADVFVVNKSDLPGAEGVKNDVATSLEFREDQRRRDVAVLLASATTERGIDGIMEHVDAVIAARKSAGTYDAARARVDDKRIEAEMRELVRRRREAFGARRPDIFAAVRERRMSPRAAAARLMEDEGRP